MLITIVLMIVYQLLQIICIPFIVFILLFLQAKKGVIGNLKERLGFVPKATKGHSAIWFHAVSVGEVLSIQELINRIKQEMPGTLCYLTVGTITGKRMAHTHIKADYISYLPYDFLPAMLLAYLRIKPKALIVIESELWPNLLAIAKLAKVPAYLLNARINPRSLSRIQTFKTIFRTLFNSFTAIFTQTEKDAELFSKLNIPNEKINILGNLKSFNVWVKKTTYLKNLGYKPHHPSNMKILLAGSIHPLEDLIYIDLFKTLKNHHPGLKLFLAPRHFSWQETLIHNVKKAEHSFFVWTEQHPLQTIDHVSFSQALEQTLILHDIILVCKLGELFTLYPYADVFFLGGTFVPIGGHNLLEPAVWSIPTVVGPHHQNCADFVKRLKKLNGIITVQTQNDLIAQTNQLLLNQPLREAVGLTSYQLVKQEAQRVQQTLELLLKQLKKR